MPRTLNDCSPIVRRCPPTFWLAFDSAVDQLTERQALALQPIGVDLDVVLLGVAAEADDVDDAGTCLNCRSRIQSCAVFRSVSE